MTKDNIHRVVTTFMLSRALKVLLDAFQLDSALYSFDSLRRGWPTSTCRASMDHLHIKCYSMWCDALGTYVTAPCITDLLVAVGFTAITAATL